MEKGQSIISQLVLKTIEDNQDEIDDLVLENKKIEINNIPKDKINTYFKKGFNKLKLSKTDYLILRNYNCSKIYFIDKNLLLIFKHLK